MCQRMKADARPFTKADARSNGQATMDDHGEKTPLIILRVVFGVGDSPWSLSRRDEAAAQRWPISPPLG